jgi:uncharacterized membrane protein YfcA
VALGVAAGAMGGLLGIGGGVLIVPGLVFLVGLTQHRAHGTSLVSVLGIAFGGLIVYGLHGKVDWLVAVGIAVGGIAGAVFGAKVANAVNGRTLRRIFAAFLLLVSVRMILTGLGHGHYAGAEAASTSAVTHWAIVLATGLVTGFVSGLMGVGGGIIMIPAMVLLLGLPQIEAQGVSLAAMIPTALSGIRAHYRAGNVDMSVGKWTGLGAVGGAVIGATVAHHLQNNVLQLVFAGFLVFTAALMLSKK